MGILKPCLTSSGDSVVSGLFALYDEVAAIAESPMPGNPGFDDLMGEPFLEDANDDQIGERVRPEIEIAVLGKIMFFKYEEQIQDPTGNAPRSSARFRVVRSELVKRGLLVNGVVVIRPNDRLLSLKDRKGRLRWDFTDDDRDGLFVTEVRPGETGSNVVDIMLEKRRPVQQ